MVKELGFEGNCRTTAMGIMPHRNVERALELSLKLDIPFWPQLPNVSYYEDMYAQASEHFPGITVDVAGKTIRFDSELFEEQLMEYTDVMADPDSFSLNEEHSVVYHQFLEKDLKTYPAIRGQLIGPVSFGFKIMDENGVPLIYNEQARVLLFDFLQRKMNAQYRELKEKNPNAFVWLDEPGLGWVFSGLSGYNDARARQDYQEFVNGIEGPGALHLCANVNLPYLLDLGISLLSFDAYQIEFMPKEYASSVNDFINRNGIIAWGIVPTDSLTLEAETPESLAERLLEYWGIISENFGTGLSRIAQQSLIAPARCCLKNMCQTGAQDDRRSSDNLQANDSTIEERVVERAFDYLGTISGILTTEIKL